MNKELLEKYFSNRCTEEELKSVLKWFAESSYTSEGKSLLHKIWEDLPDKNDNLKTDFDLLLDRIHHKVNLAQSKELLYKADQDLIKYKRKERFLKTLMKVAAILLLPVLGFGLYMSARYQSARNTRLMANQTYNEVFSSVDAITKVTLPDGSKVWLNHSSSLKYPAIFLGNTRNVELKGEGYFEVVHNTKIPFIVKTSDIQIKAVGTTFNIMAYPDEDRIETSLINGKIELEKASPNGKIIPLLKMKPQDFAVFKKSNNEITNRTITDDRYFSWKDGKLIFDAEPMHDVVKKLSRWFNVDIQINDPMLLDLTYTATFTHETLPQVLELMSLISPVSFSVQGRKEIGPGTFSKEKVLLKYKKK
jgi:transmembrane sensor